MTYKEAIELRNRMEKQASLDKQADAARNSAVQRYRQGLANGTAKPNYRQGDWSRMMANAPLAAQVFNPELYTNKDVWSDVNNGRRAAIRGALKGVSSSVAGAMSLPNTIQRAYDATVNTNEPEYQGKNWMERYKSSYDRNSTGWTGALDRGAQRYQELMEEGMDAVPGLAYTNDFEEKYPLAKAIGEHGGQVIGSLGAGRLFGALAKPFTSAVSATSAAPAAATATQTAGAMPAAAATAQAGVTGATAAPGMFQKVKTGIDAGNQAYGWYKTVANN